MEKDKLTREEALRRFKAACDKKAAYVVELEKRMREDYRRRTGKEAVSFNVW